MHFASIEPFGPGVEDLRGAVLAATVANGAGGKEGGGSFEPREFMQGNREENLGELDVEQTIDALTAMLGAAPKGTGAVTPEKKSEEQQIGRAPAATPRTAA